MRHFVLVACMLLGADAARRSRPVQTSTAPTPLESEGRQLAFAGQPEDLESLWDNLDIQKLDNRADSWRKTTLSPNDSNAEFYGQGQSPGRQYPGLPGNPGDSNELPSPIATRPPPPPPILPPGCLAPRGQFPSAKSCANYLNCWDDVVIEQTCPTGLLFNDRTGVCDFDYNVNCGSRPLPTPKPPLPPGSKLCPDPNGRYRSSTNCSEFYVCVAGRPIKFSCPRGLVYNDILNVCDYPYNVDCGGAATPKPLPPTTQPTNPPHPPTHPSQPPTHPSQPPTYPPQPPTYPSQPPTYPSQPPTYPSQPPTYPPQPPTYPPQPSYPGPQPSYPAPQPSYPNAGYPGNPWLKTNTEWQQRVASIQADEDDQEVPTEDEVSEDQTNAQEPQDTTAISSPWNPVQAVPASLSKVPCENGEIHRLTESCSSVVVCRSGRPQLVQCPTGFTYDKPSDSCKPFTLAKC